MAFSSSPRKIVPLSTGESPRNFGHRSEGSSSSKWQTKRVFTCGVVVEGSESGRRLPEEIEELVLSLGDLMGSDNASNIQSSEALSGPSDHPTSRKRALTESSAALTSSIKELVTTEQNYVQRLKTLKNNYADPLRNFSKSKDTAIIPVWEARILFGNIDHLLLVNQAFLNDLENMGRKGGLSGVGDVALKHFKECRGFEQYKQYYAHREEAQRIFEKEMAKRGSPFGEFIDRIKYQSSDIKNRVGLRELLMEPVQRIPRYTLLFRSMMKEMVPGDPQLAKLTEADKIASSIARAEADEETMRAATFHCLSATVGDFPAELVSFSRRKFIDCIDVEDILGDIPMSSGASTISTSMSSSVNAPLHCTLFLFDDKLLIVKRPNGEKGGRALSGLEELPGILNGGRPASMKKKKTGMTCKGVVDITDVVATDIGGADFHLYLENPPHDQGERWSGRPFRALSVVHPPAPANLNPTETERDKQRFMENLWNAQAKFRARGGQSVVLRSGDVEVNTKGGKTTTARAYYNVYQRTAFLQETKKTKVVVHIDTSGSADNLPFGIDSPPFVVIRLQPLPGGVCRYTVTSIDPDDKGEEDIVVTTRVPSRIIFTIDQFGLFQFRTGRNNSRPSTPTAKSKASMFGLDAIGRNFFNTSRPVSDFFAGSVNGSWRNKSTASRSSVYTNTTGDGSLTKFSSRSTASVATTVDDDSTSSVFGRSPKTKKLLKRGMSPGSMSDGDRGASMSPSRSGRRSKSASRLGDSDEEESTTPAKKLPVNASERNLMLQLDLARRNSKSQAERLLPTIPFEPSSGGIIYEEDQDMARPASRASSSQCTITQSFAGQESPTRTARSLSRNSSSGRHPRGPRSPSPLPPKNAELPAYGPMVLDEPDHDDIFSPTRSNPAIGTSSRPTGIPRSKRQPLNSTGNTHSDASRQGSAHGAFGNSGATIIPLSIKKKSSVRSTTDMDVPPSPTPTRKNIPRNSPLVRPAAHLGSLRKGSPPRGRQPKATTSSTTTYPGIDMFEQAIRLAVSTKEDVESCYRTVKRIKLEVEGHKPQAGFPGEISRPSSPVKGLRPVQPSTPMTKAAQERLEEMRQLIGQRQGEVTPSSRPKSFIDNSQTPVRGMSIGDSSQSEFHRTMGTLVSEADKGLAQVISNQDVLHTSLERLTSAFQEKSGELEKTKQELGNARRQTEVFKSLLADATTEKEIMYEAFNEELDGMYNDANMLDDEAWSAMSNDLRRTKEARNKISKENSSLKQRLAEIELQQEEWAILLRSHGLIP